MISYRLKCEHGHRFDSWFKSAGDYEKLLAAGMVECAVCGASKLEKTIMAPNVTGTRENNRQNPAKAMIKKMRDEVKNAKNVGWQFAKEARAIHYGDKEEEPIYGKTEPEEAIKLIEEGVKIAPLPFDPDKKEN